MLKPYAVIYWPIGELLSMGLIGYCYYFVTFQATPRIGVAIGAKILDLSKVFQLFDGPLMTNNQHVFQQVCINYGISGYIFVPKIRIAN